MVRTRARTLRGGGVARVPAPPPRMLNSLVPLEPAPTTAAAAMSVPALTLIRTTVLFIALRHLSTVVTLHGLADTAMPRPLPLPALPAYRVGRRRVSRPLMFVGRQGRDLERDHVVPEPEESSRTTRMAQYRAQRVFRAAGERSHRQGRRSPQSRERGVRQVSVTSRSSLCHTGSLRWPRSARTGSDQETREESPHEQPPHASCRSAARHRRRRRRPRGRAGRTGRRRRPWSRRRARPRQPARVPPDRHGHHGPARQRLQLGLLQERGVRRQRAQRRRPREGRHPGRPGPRGPRRGEHPPHRRRRHHPGHAARLLLRQGRADHGSRGRCTRWPPR